MRAALALLMLAGQAMAGANDPVCRASINWETMVCTTPPPPGTGLGADGRGIVHLPQPGLYQFFGATVNRTPGPRYYREASYGSVVATSSRVEWVRPDGIREPIPTIYLYPPVWVAP